MTLDHEDAIKEINIRANRAEELATALRRYAAQMENDREMAISERMNWAINEIENFVRNINFATLARAQARITKPV